MISNIYTYLPVDCGGYYAGDQAIPPATLLNILLLTSSSPTSHNSFLPQTDSQNYYSGYNNNQLFLPQSSGYQNSLTSLLINSISGIRSGQVSGARGGLKTGNPDNKDNQLLFNRGLARLKKDPAIYKYVRSIKNPFNSQGKVVIDASDIKSQIQNKKFPCKQLAKRKWKKVCRDIRRRKSSNRRRKYSNKKRKIVKKANQSQGIIRDFWDSILNVNL